MDPIRSGRDLRQARAALHELRIQLARLRSICGHDRDTFHRATRGLRRLARETLLAIRAYEQARAGRLPPVVHTRNPHTGHLEIPRVLRCLRIAAGLDQATLAARLGTRQSDISRWEHEGYDRYRIATLRHIADALDHDIDIAFIRRTPAPPTPDSPEGGRRSPARRGPHPGPPGPDPRDDPDRTSGCTTRSKAGHRED